MRMTNYTAHYQLHQWEPEDSFLRTDFNEDFAKIDGALGGRQNSLRWIRLPSRLPGNPSW